jgi:hypothetical protein
MAPIAVPWLICDGVIRVELVDTGERLHSSARGLERLVQTFGRSRGESDRAAPRTPGSTS